MSAKLRKAELARMLGVTRARVSQLVTAGLPVEADGRLDRTAALGWIAAYCSSAGAGWGHRGKADIADVATKLLVDDAELAAGESAQPAQRPPSTGDPFTEGVRFGAAHVWFSLRSTLPEMLADWKLDIHWKAVFLAHVDFFLERWLRELELGMPSPMDFSSYGPHEKDMKRAFQWFREWLAEEMDKAHQEASDAAR